MRIASVACAVAVLSAAGCTAAPAPTAAPSATATSSPSATPPAPPDELHAEPFDGEKVVLSLDSRHGGYLTDVPVESDRANVYLRCVGSGSLSVVITDVARFEYPCGVAGDPGELDSFDVRYVDRLHLEVTQAGEGIWALAITAVPLDR